ncbi:MAG TPA: trimeric intracellular cation channel family protein [Gemmatimonadaceae bacterium]|nr:trimeric intracellular cation channel family protein [Gemmatimonadaceae bacterium]
MLHAFDLIGIAVFAISGALAAGRKGLDLIGVLVLAIVTAVGGGTIRDVLLDRHPIVWLHEPAYLVVMVASAFATMIYVRFFRPPEALLLVADALGLALFSVAGAQIAERAGLPALGCVLLGTITGSAGGLVRDVLTAEIPLVLKRGDLYASAAIIGTSIYLALEALGASQQSAALTGMALVAIVRLAAIWWRLRLPVFEVQPTRP